MAQQYTILKNDCLSILAERFNTTPEILMSLNSEQIKNPDLIYEGDKLTLPDPAIESIPLDGSRTELPKPPEELAGGVDTCSEPLDFADILYLPAHPKTGKKCWYSITEDAKNIIEKEKALLDTTIVEGNVQATTQNLSKLGVLSKFAAKHFEQFMSQENADDYKTLNLFKLVITRYLYKKTDNDPFDVLYDMAQKANIELGSIKRKVAQWKKYVEKVQDDIERTNAMARDRANSRVDAISGASINTAREARNQQANVDQYVLDQLHNTVLDDITDKIESMEEAAIDKAEEMNSDDGTHFVYREELKYFTSKQQETIEKYAKMLSDNHDEMSIAQLPHDKAKAKLSALIQQPQEAQSPYGVNWYSAAVSNLNRQGLVVKEQCLTLAQLEGDSPANQGPKVLNEKMPDWRLPNQVIDIKKDKLIEELYIQSKGDRAAEDIVSLVNDVALDWSYYPSLALKTLIDNTITEHQKNLAQVLGTTLPLDELFNKLLWVKKVANARIELLKSVAQSRLESPNPTLEFQSPFVASLPAKLTLLWDNSYKPKMKNKAGFENQAELNDLQVVECSLMSSGELFYLRGPAWYMPESNKDSLYLQAKGHVRNITGQIQFASQQSNSESVATSLSDALEKLKESEVKLDLLPLTKEKKFDTAFWSDGYHYQGGTSPDGKEAQYSADAGAQLFRFSSKAAATLNTPLSNDQNMRKNPKQLGGSGEVSANFALLQAQASFMFWLPFGDSNNEGVKDIKDVKGYDLTLAYVDAHNTQKEYEAGCLAAKIEGSVYGLACASCQLSSKVAFGASDTGSGNFGLKGSSVTAFDPNIQSTNVLNSGPVSSDYALDAGVTVDAFAGVEAGGTLGATVYWWPPKDTNEKKLGSINGELSASFGAGAKGEFRLLFQGGVLVLVSSAKLVMGPGAGGKLAINLDMLGVDRFVDTLLGVLKQHDFKRLAVFGDVDEDGKNEEFVKLNNVLTLAMTMGLTVADVLLMPVSTWAKYEQSTLSKEYAPLLAGRTISDDPKVQREMKNWVIKLPPETLRNLLITLIKEQDKPYQRFTVEQSNQRLAQSIVQIMQWLVDDENDNISSKRQWKESLIRMNNDPAILQDKPLQWESFKDNWFKLARFVNKFKGSTVADSLLVNRFDEYSRKLCQNMKLTYADVMEDPLANSYQSSYVTLPKVKVRRYHAYPASMVENPDAKNKAIQIRNTDGEIETKQEFIMEWTINAALS
ncbi:LysM peptidoglycan-binding domain-containing protein [Vibrio litoralis]|uniref:LysM peptidoglycan-binding domain-containing protein n=1 Tax=Vibrio litoralis TaxID=335972 RepID=UPI001865A68A|nr:LysM peptidoglycan-binding domain-containing protein [Vibrio litoralis]